MPAIDPTLTVEVISPTLIYVHSDQELVIDANMLDETKWNFGVEFGVAIYAVSVHPINLSSDPTKTIEIHVELSGMTFGGKYTLQPLGALGFAGFAIVSFSGPEQVFGITSIIRENLNVQGNTNVNKLYMSNLHVTLDFALKDSAINVNEFSMESPYPILPDILAVEIEENHKKELDVLFTKETDYSYALNIGEAVSEDFWTRLNDPQSDDYPIAENAIQDTQLGFYHSIGAAQSASPVVLSFGSDIDSTQNLIFNIGFFSSPIQNNPNTSTCVFNIDDGVTLVSILITQNSIRMVSGNTDISAGVHFEHWVKPIKVIRNVQHGFWAVSLDGMTLLNAPIAQVNGPSVNASSIQLVLPATAPNNNAFVQLSSLNMSFSKSLYSSFGNPIHNLKAPFQGVATTGHTIDFFYTGRGPLVKDDLAKHPEPAEVQDVQVYINDVQVEVKSVNPYLGRIELVTPVPRSALGNQTDTIEVDYCWFPNPRFSFAKLNMPGLVLNKWNIKTGRNTSTHGHTQTGEKSTEGERFSMCQGLVEHSSIQPLEVSHRHLGFEDEYTGALNQPMGFVLNAKPHAFSAATAEQRTLWHKSRLNRWNKVHSGEFEKDTTPETVNAILHNRTIQLHHQHIKAKTIFYVMIGGMPIAHDEWVFDHHAQRIDILSDRPNSPVTVIFSPDKPLTNTYIEKQPLEGGVTNLNEGTPPMVKTHAELYSSLEFMEVDNGGQTKQIAIADDGPYPGQGFREIDVKGRMVTEYEPIVKQPLVTQGGGAMGSFLIAGGGAYTNLNQLGHIEGGTWRRNPKTTWPLHPSNATPGRGIQRTHWLSKLAYEEGTPVTVLEESSCIAILLDFDGEQRIGPWSDLNALTPESLMASSVDENQEPEGLVLQGGNVPNLPTRTVYSLV